MTIVVFIYLFFTPNEFVSLPFPEHVFCKFLFYFIVIDASFLIDKKFHLLWERMQNAPEIVE